MDHIECPRPTKKLFTDMLTHHTLDHKYQSADHSSLPPMSIKKDQASLSTIVIDDDELNPEDELKLKYDALTPEQQEFCNLVVGSQCNLFLTGVPGSGKTHTLKIARQMLIQAAAKRHILKNNLTMDATKIDLYCSILQDRFPICAPTAMAASHIPGATTLHSALHLPIHLDARLPKLNQILPKAISKYNSIDVIFLDEISMVHPRLFEWLIHCLDIARKDPEYPQRDALPRIIVMGDFYQLSPVDTRPWDEQRASPLPKLFETEQWQRLKFKTVYLEKSIRQDNDDEFFAVNMAIREGNLNDNILKYLKNKQKSYVDTWRCVDKERQIYNKPTRLCTTNAKVDQENQAELKALNQPIHEYNGHIFVTKHEYVTVQSKAATLAFTDYVVTTHRDIAIYSDEHIGLPTTLKDKLVDMKLRSPLKSRLSIGAQVVLTVNLESVLSGPKALINGLKGVVTGFDGQFPKIHFVNQRKVIIRPWLNEVEQPLTQFPKHDKTDHVHVYTYTLPLRLAWAETIHSAQGSTLSMAHIEANGSMQPGQFYVALSRCKNGNDVSWNRFDERCVVVDAKVQSFYSKIKQEKMMQQLEN